MALKSDPHIFLGSADFASSLQGSTPSPLPTKPGSRKDELLRNHAFYERYNSLSRTPLQKVKLPANVNSTTVANFHSPYAKKTIKYEVTTHTEEAQSGQITQTTQKSPGNSLLEVTEIKGVNPPLIKESAGRPRHIQRARPTSVNMTTGLNETEPDQSNTGKRDASVDKNNNNLEQFKKTVNRFWNKSFDKTTENFPDYIRMKSIGIVYDSPAPMKQNNATWKGMYEQEKKSMSEHNLKKLIRRKKIIVGSAIKFLRKTSPAHQTTPVNHVPSIQQRKLYPKSIDMSNNKNIRLSVEPLDSEPGKPIYTSVHRFSPSETFVKTEGDGPRIIQKILRAPSTSKNSKLQKSDREIFSPYPKEIADYQLKICNTNQDLSPMAHSKSLGSLHISPGLHRNSLSKTKITFIGANTPTRMRIKPIPLESLVRPQHINVDKLIEAELFHSHQPDLGQSKIEGWT